MRIIGALWSRVTSLPHMLFVKAAVVGLVYLLGLAHGNYHATEAAHIRDMDESARRQAQNHIEILAAKKDEQQRLKAAFEQREAADRAAYNTLADGKSEIEQVAQRALSALARERASNTKLAETTDGLKKVNELLAAEARIPDPGCVMPERVRAILDTAIANVSHYPEPGNPPEPPSSISIRDGGTPSVLTCDQLERGFIEILTRYGRLKARHMAAGAWVNDDLK